MTFQAFLIKYGEIGLKGKEIGSALQELLELVSEGTLENNRDTLLSFLRK